MKPTKTLNLYQLYFPLCYRCHACQKPKIASAVQILSNSLSDRRRYFCLACATEKGMPPSKELLSRLPQAQEAQAKAGPGQKRKKAVARSGRK